MINGKLAGARMLCWKVVTESEAIARFTSTSLQVLITPRCRLNINFTEDFYFNTKMYDIHGRLNIKLQMKYDIQ